jgi:hypothetical protein
MSVSLAGELSAQPISPSRVKFSAEMLPLNVALKELQEQTGNAIQDLRTNGDAGRAMVTTKSGEFWPALDALCESAGTGFNAYKLDGAIALVDAPYRKSKTVHYQGICRFDIKRIELVRDEETLAHHCHVTLDTAWEPRFQALFVNLEQGQVAHGKHVQKIDGDSSTKVAGKCATQSIKLIMKAPARQTAKLDSLRGTIRIVGVPKMLDFRFAGLKDKNGAVSETQDEVKVNVTRLEGRKAYWSVDVETLYPPGAIHELQSFEQSDFLDMSRVWLTWGIDPRTKKPYELESRGQDPQSATKTRHTFEPRGGTPLPPPGAAVTLRYRVPGRLVAFAVPFEFRDVLLP